MDVCGCASHMCLHACAFIITRMWTKIFLRYCVRNVNGQVCVSGRESIVYKKPLCVRATTPAAATQQPVHTVCAAANKPR